MYERVVERLFRVWSPQVLSALCRLCLLKDSCRVGHGNSEPAVSPTLANYQAGWDDCSEVVVFDKMEVDLHVTVVVLWPCTLGLLLGQALR